MARFTHHPAHPTGFPQTAGQPTASGPVPHRQCASVRPPTATSSPSWREVIKAWSRPTLRACRGSPGGAGRRSPVP